MPALYKVLGLYAFGKFFIEHRKISHCFQLICYNFLKNMHKFELTLLCEHNLILTYFLTKRDALSILVITVHLILTL